LVAGIADITKVFVAVEPPDRVQTAPRQTGIEGDQPLAHQLACAIASSLILPCQKIAAICATQIVAQQIAAHKAVGAAGAVVAYDLNQLIV
jgi:hypothetical protein